MGTLPPFAKASSLIVARASESMTSPVTPTVPGGPIARRWPTPKRRMSISSAALGSPLVALRPDRRLGPRRVRAGEVALACELMLVRLEQRRVAPEPCVGHDAETRDEDGEDHREIEHEDCADDHEEERDQAGPEDPLPHVEIRAVAMKRPSPERVEDDQDDEEDERGDPDLVEEVRKVDPVEPDPEVFPGQQRHRLTLCWGSRPARPEGGVEYATA